jgi:hypothetical protein
LNTVPNTIQRCHLFFQELMVTAPFQAADCPTEPRHAVSLQLPRPALKRIQVWVLHQEAWRSAPTERLRPIEQNLREAFPVSPRLFALEVPLAVISLRINSAFVKAGFTLNILRRRVLCCNPWFRSTC